MGSLQCSSFLCTVSRSSKASGQVKLWLDCSGFGSDLSFQLHAEHMPAVLSGYLAFKGLLFRDVAHITERPRFPWTQRGPLSGAYLFLCVLQTTKCEPFADLFCSL